MRPCQYAISNLCLNFTFSSSDNLVKAMMIRALEVELCPVAVAALLAAEPSHGYAADF